MRIRSQLRFLTIYSAVITLVFAATVYCGFIRSVGGASKVKEFDRISVHRIDVVEPDGTPRLFISDRAEFPGDFFHGRELQRRDRKDSAGMLFINDEGTEDGGLIYGGVKSNGKPSSFSHLSFDQYDQDQTVTIGTALQDGQRTAGIALNDVPLQAMTPDLIEEGERIKNMPHGPARGEAWAALQKKFPISMERASLLRQADGAVGLTLKDKEGRKRLVLSVGADGKPSIELLDEHGQVQRNISVTQ